MNVTTVTEQVRALFGQDHAALNAAVAAAPAGAQTDSCCCPISRGNAPRTCPPARACCWA
jgi:hypothetical protein